MTLIFWRCKRFPDTKKNLKKNLKNSPIIVIAYGVLFG